MPRCLLGIFILLLASVSSMQAQGDAVLFTIGAEPVSRGEFEYRLRRSSEKRQQVLLQTWIRFKQKIQWAKDLGLDTLSSYRQQTEAYRNKLDAKMETTEKDGRYSSGREWIRLQHVTYPLTQHAGKRKERDARKWLDSLYIALQKGENVTWKTLPWTQTRHLLNEWQWQLENLEKGEYSQPFFSSLGGHIIVWTDRRLDTSWKEDAFVADSTYRLKEMEEALLLVQLEDYWERTLMVTEKELETYFLHHREALGWGTPHYKGAVIHCQSKQEAKKIRKYLKGYPDALWKKACERMPAEVSKGCLIETGLFAIGSNPYVDKLAFKCGTFKPLADYPYTLVVGKILKKGPTVYTDVRKEVEKSCKKAKKEAEFAAFTQKYRVEINEEVLKTVNHYGNK